jgi:hypothetical protein
MHKTGKIIWNKINRKHIIFKYMSPKKNNVVLYTQICIGSAHMVRKISRLAANKSSTKQKAGSTTNIKQSPSAHKQASNEAQGIQARTHQVTLIKEAAASSLAPARKLESLNAWCGVRPPRAWPCRHRRCCGHPPVASRRRGHPSGPRCSQRKRDHLTKQNKCRCGKSDWWKTL